MVNSQLAKTFSTDKHGFFSRLTLNEAPEIRLAKVRNRSRYRYELNMFMDLLNAEGRAFKENNLYIESMNERFCYQYLDASGQRILGESNGLSDILKTTAQQGQKGFYFVAQHRSLIEQEFNDLYAVLLKNEAGRDVLWLYCYSLCFDLENYYLDDAYPNPVEAAKYYRLRKSLEYRCQYGRFAPEDIGNGIERHIGEQMRAAIADMLDTLRHTSAIRGWLGFINLHRILFVFSRLAVKQALILANELKWLDSLTHLIGVPIDVNALLSMINMPNGVFNLLSVGVFEVRLCVILCEIMKHVVFAPTAKENSRTKSERLKQELLERYLDIYNDLAWAIVNTLCNFGYLAGPMANQLTVVFLLFDALAVMARHYMARQDYLLKKEQYDNELQFYKGPCAYAIEQINQQIRVLEEQSRQLDIEWGANSAKLIFLVEAALLLMGGFSASLLLAAPAASAASFMTCTVAVAMFFSSGDYQAYTKATLIQQDAEPGDVLSATAVSDTRWSFYKAMVKNTTMPLVMVTAFAVYWPGALLLAMGYIFNENRGASPKQPMLIPNDEMVEREREADVQYLDHNPVW